MFKKVLPYLILLLLLMPVVWPLIQPGFFVTDDGNWMIIRLSAFNQTLRTGQFPVRFLERLNHGYGYPVADFLYPLPLYLGEIVHLAGFGFINSIKILFLASFILGGIFMYRYVGLVAAIVYSYAPYRLFDVYKRGSLGEAVAFIFLPLIFFFIDKKNIFLSAIFTAALVTSHNTVAFLFLPIILFYSKSIKLIIWSLLLSAFFWVPALYDLQFTRAGQTIVSNFADYFLISDNFLQIGGLVVVAVILISLYRKTSRFFFLVTLGSLFLALPVSAPFWSALPLPRLVQFPWRFLSVTIFCTAILAGQIAQKNKWLSMVIIVTTILLSLPYINIQKSLQPDGYYSTNDDTTTVKNEYMPKWVTGDPMSQPSNKVEISPDGKTAQINNVYFPGWEVFVNDQKVPIDYQTNGLMRVTINNAEDKITTKFTETPLRLFADLLSLFSLLALVILKLRQPVKNGMQILPSIFRV